MSAPGGRVEMSAPAPPSGAAGGALPPSPLGAAGGGGEGDAEAN